MKKIALGDIARKIGLSKVLRELEESQEPIVIRRDNVDRAILMPAFDGMVEMFEQYSSMMKTVGEMVYAGYSHEAVKHLVLQVAIGEMARYSLILWGAEPSDLRTKTDAIFKDLSDLELQFRFQKNSSEDSRSVSPMTTTSADVSEVKPDAGDVTSPAPSRKKRASSPQKRKIGTKREKSA